MHPRTPAVNWVVIRSLFDELIASESAHDSTEMIDFESIINDTQAGLVESLEKVHRYAERLGATLASSPAGHAFVNGKHFDMGDVCWFRKYDMKWLIILFQTFLRSMQMEIGEQLHYVQEKVDTLVVEDARLLTSFSTRSTMAPSPMMTIIESPHISMTYLQLVHVGVGTSNH
jgi:UDP-glucose:glycoprotein glucosyltransferase